MTVNPVEIPKDFSKKIIKNNCNKPIPTPHHVGDQPDITDVERLQF